MAGDLDAGRGARPRQGRGLRDGVRVQVAGRDRAALRRQLADQLAAHAGAAAGHHRELPGERVHCDSFGPLDQLRLADQTVARRVVG